MADEISTALAEAFKGSPVDTEGTNTIESLMAQAETKAEETAKVETTAQNTESSLTATEKVEEKTETQPVKSFDELLAERSGGKFSKWEDIETVVNAPKEELDDEIKHFQELKKNGVKIDREFLEVYTKDYDSITDASTLLKEAMRLDPDNKGLSDAALEFKLKQKYNFSQWAEEGDEPTETELVMKELMAHDAEVSLAKLKERQKQLTSVPTKAPVDVEAQKEQQRKYLQEAEKYIDTEVMPKITKLSFITDEKTKESFDFEVSEADRKDVANMMKLMESDVSVFWNQFKDEKGEFSRQQLAEMLLWNKNRNNISKAVYQNALAKGREAEIKEIKNIDFKPDGKPSQTKGNSMADAFKKHFS